MASAQCNKPSQDTNHHHVQSSTHKTNPQEHSLANKVKKMAGKMFPHDQENRCQKHTHEQVHKPEHGRNGNNCIPMIREHLNMHKHENKTKKKSKEGKHNYTSDSSSSDNDNDARKKKD